MRLFGVRLFGVTEGPEYLRAVETGTTDKGDSIVRQSSEAPQKLLEALRAARLEERVKQRFEHIERLGQAQQQQAQSAAKQQS